MIEVLASRPVRAHLLGLVIGFGVLYALTADWTLTANVDAIAAALPAWSVATEGTLYLDRFASANPWMLESPGGWVSNRAPGVIAIGIPAYLISQLSVFSNVPATATAIAATVGALVVLYVVLCRIVPARVALAAAVVMGAGTSTWQISADQLWPHGPGQLWAALGLLGLSGAAYTRSGWALAAALLTRPITAVSTAVIGLAEAWRDRSIRRAVLIGAPAAVGLAALLIYNRLVFGTVSISGGYPSTFTDRLTSEPAGSHAANVVGFFFSPENGIFVWSPIVLVGAAGLIGAWRTCPGWARSAVVGAVVLIVLHARLNRVSGGIPFGYRYPLEALMLAAPALTLGANRIWTGLRRGPLLVIGASVISIVLQIILVLVIECTSTGALDYVTCSLPGGG
jgi:hypothetical protein